MRANEPLLDEGWLVRIFEECGLEPPEAREAGRIAWLRVLKRERDDPGRPSVGRRAGIRAAIVRDPLVSFNRIVGIGDERLPFLDEERGTLSLVAFATLFDEVGMEPDVALAFAKVVSEAYGPNDLFQPVWEALGQTGPVDLEALRTLDWSPLRAGVPELEGGQRTPVQKGNIPSKTSGG